MGLAPVSAEAYYNRVQGTVATSHSARGWQLGVNVCMSVAFLAFACGEVSTPTQVGQGGNAGSMLSVGGSAGSSGAGGMGLGGTRPDDERDAGPETGTGGGGGSSGFMYPADCPPPNPIPVVGQSIVIQSVNFNTSQIVIRNASSSPVELVGGQMGWQWCNFPGYDVVVLADVTLLPDETIAFYMIQNGDVVRPLFPGEEGDANELGIYITTGSFGNSTLIRAFVSWGAGLRGGRESVAGTAGVWTFGQRVAIAPGDDGFIITGPADRGDGYTSVPERCLVTPPNRPGIVVPMP